MKIGFISSIHQVGFEPKKGISGLSPYPPVNRVAVNNKSGSMFENESQVLKILNPNPVIDAT